MMKENRDRAAQMSSRERLLRSLRGQETDRLAWSPFLAYYWESLPPETQRMGQAAYLTQMGADPLLRGFHTLFCVRRSRCEIFASTGGGKRQVRYETPVGTLTEEYTYSEPAKSWFLTGHPVKSREDFRVLQYLFEHTEIAADARAYEADKQALGDGGLYIPVIGADMKTAFQALVEHWCGTVDLTYALCDFPEAVEECLAVMQQRNMETLEASLRSSAEALLFWEDSSTTNISPQFFERYAMPEITGWGVRIHEEGRLLVHHACGHLRDLLPLMARTPIDVIESISPPPTGNVELWEAREMLPDRIGLIGGIEPVMLKNGTEEEFPGYVEQLVSKMQGSRFILANSDSCPPDVDYRRFELVTKLVRQTAWRPCSR